MKEKNIIHFTIAISLFCSSFLPVAAITNSPRFVDTYQISDETTDNSFDEYGHRLLPDSILLFESFNKLTLPEEEIKSRNSLFDNNFADNYLSYNCFTADHYLKLRATSKEFSFLSSTKNFIDSSYSRLLNISCIAKGTSTNQKLLSFYSSRKDSESFDLTSEFTKFSYDVVSKPKKQFRYGFGIVKGSGYAYIDNFTITDKRIIVKDMTDGYCTIAAYPHSLVVPQNTEAFTLTIKNSTLYKGHVYKTGDAIPPREAVVLHNTVDKTIRLREVADEGKCDPNNLLHGANIERSAYVIYPNNDKINGSFYVLGRDSNKKNIGFYWYYKAAKGKGYFTMTPYRAFLFLPSTSAGSKISAFILDETVTGINDIQQVPMKNSYRYNLSGQMVDENYKGIVIENGKKILVK
ncbi:MAG: hypothetical protein ACOYJF_12020 [Prevotella sp.]